MFGIRDDVKEAKLKSIDEILESRGIAVKRKSGGKCFYSSPFSSDSNPSFVVYPNNTFFDWSTGTSGDSLDLIMMMDGVSLGSAANIILNGSFSKIEKKEKEKEERKSDLFCYTKYILTKDNEIEFVNEYALSRKIVRNYIPSFFFSTIDGKTWNKNICMGFIHVDENSIPCGIKMRIAESPFIRFRDKSGGSIDRFSSRGYLCSYVAGENILDDIPVLYICESETSANSLFEFLSSLNISCVVISFGGVASFRSKIPLEFSWIKDVRVIIDFDGNEEKYNKVAANYDGIGKLIKLELPKGEDINSLYVSGKLFNYKQKLL